MPADPRGYNYLLTPPIVDIPYTGPHIKAAGFDLYVGVCTDKYHSVIETGTAKNMDQFMRTTRIDIATRSVIHEYWCNTTSQCIGVSIIKLPTASRPLSCTSGILSGGVEHALRGRMFSGCDLTASSIVAHITGSEHIAPILSVSDMHRAIVSDSYGDARQIREIQSRTIPKYTSAPTSMHAITNTLTKQICDSIEYTTDRIESDHGWADSLSLSAWRDTIGDVIVAKYIPTYHLKTGTLLEVGITHHFDWHHLVTRSELLNIRERDLAICRFVCGHILHKWRNIIELDYRGSSIQSITIIKTPTDCAVILDDKLLVAYTHAPSFVMYGSLYVDMS